MIMNQIKYVICAAIASTLLIVGITAFADSTSDAIDSFMQQQAYFDLYKNDKSSPSSISDAGTENILKAEGGLAYSATDLSLPGKGGFDLNLVRNYNSNEGAGFDGYTLTYSVGEWQHIDTFNDSRKFVFRYYVDGDTSTTPVYIAYGSESELLAKENNGSIQVASNYTSQKVTNWGTITDLLNYSLDSRSPNEIGFAVRTPFYHASALPSGTAVTLVRDLTTHPDILVLSTVNSYIHDEYMFQKGLNIGHGWGMSLPEARIDAMQTYNAQRAIEMGTFVDPDNGMMVNYYLNYRDWIFTGYDDYDANFYLYTKRVITYDNNGNETSAGMYKVEAVDTIYNYDYDELPSATTDAYRLKITRYDGTEFHFRPVSYGAMEMILLRKVDKYGNTIYYCGDNGMDGMIDSYGRNIEFVWQDNRINEIKVNGISAVKYFITEENDTILDPNQILTEDNVYKLKVQKGLPDITDEFVTYTSKYKTNLWYTSSVLDKGARVGLPIEKFLITEIETSSGGKTKYDYTTTVDKITNQTHTERERDKVIQRAEYLPGSTTPVNKFTYTYDVSDADNKTITISKTGETYTVVEIYDEDNNRTKETVTTENVITENVYEYEKQGEGNYLPIKITTKRTKPGDTNCFQEVVTQRTYNSKQQLLTESDGLHETINNYDYNYGVLTRQTQKQSDDLVVGIVNTLTSDDKSISYTSNIKRYATATKDTVMENTYFSYNDNGDITRVAKVLNSPQTFEQLITYTYPDIASASSSSPALIKTITVTDVENITDDNGENPAKKDIVTVEEYNLFGNLIKKTDNNTRVTTIAYDSIQRPVLQTNPDNSTTQISYNGSDNYIIATDPRGVRQKIQYDALGRETTVYIENENEEFEKVKTTEYDSYSRASKQILFDTPTTEKSRVEYTYYGDNQVESEIVKEGNAVLSEKEYDEIILDADTQVAQVTTDTDGFRQEAVYLDKWGRLKSKKINASLNDTQTTEYYTNYTTDILGNVLTETDNMNCTTSYTYDHLNRVVTTTNAENNSMRTTYDNGGNIVSVRDYADNTTTYAYNTLGQLIQTTTPIKTDVSSVNKRYYDSYGNLTRVAQQNNKIGEAESYTITRYLYDSMNRPVTSIGQDGTTLSVTKHEYDVAGNLLKQITGLTSLTETVNPETHAVTEYAYNNLNKPVSVTDALGQTSTAVYDNLGNMLTLTDRNGTTTNYTYDGLGRMKSRTAGGLTEQYSYNKLGTVSSMTDATGTTNYTYNGFGWLTEETKGDIIKNYSYAVDGTRTAFTLSNGSTQELSLTYTYDIMKRLKTVVHNGETTTYNYDENGNLTSQRAGGTVAYTTYGYNLANQLETKVNFKKDGRMTRYGIENYLDGNIASIEEYQRPKMTYTYDGMGRLKTEERAGEYKDTYTYDAFGNRSQKVHEDLANSTSAATSYTYDLNNRLLKTVETAGDMQSITDISYDPNGNQLMKLDSVIAPMTTEDVEELLLSEGLGGVDTYEYDAFNRLTKSVVDGTAATYTYDANNLRQSKTSGGVTTNHVYDGQNIVLDVTGTTKQAYIRGMGLISMESGGTKEYYHTNWHGDVVALTTANGTVTANYGYDAFGNPLAENENDTNPFRYCGEYFDQETGNVYLRNRYYDTSAGRFITEDPIRDGTNWYTYCAGNPVMFTDPMGFKYTFKSKDDADKAVGLMRESSGYDGYYVSEQEDGSYTILDNGEGKINENKNSAIARAVYDAAINIEGDIPVVYDEKLLEHDFTFYKEDGSILEMRLGKWNTNAQYQQSFIHETTHAVVKLLGFDEQIIFAAQEGASEANIIAAKEIVKNQYMEAVAITVERQMNNDLGYAHAPENVGINEYGTFPYQFTTDPRVSKMVGGDIPIRNIVRAATLKSRGSGIVSYFLANYKH